MDNDGGRYSKDARARALAFWWRLTDNAFRRLVWYSLPVLLITGIGVLQASKTLELYSSSGVLSATSNPLVPDQPIAGTSAQYWETTAAATSRTINEQLRTDRFIERVAQEAGLGDAVENGLVTLDIVRSSIYSYDDGTSLVNVGATWDSPDTAYQLVLSAIQTYQDYLAETVASDSSEAVTFYTGQLDQYRADAQVAETELVSYLDGLSSDGDPTLSESLQIQRLTDAVSAAERKVSDTEQNIEEAQLIVAQSMSEAGRSLTMIDAPQLPTSPESTLMEQAMTVISYALLGVIVAVAALLVSTVLDNSVASTSDLVGPGIAFVATVPTLRLVTPKAASQKDVGRRRDRQTEPDEAAFDTAGVR